MEESTEWCVDGAHKTYKSFVNPDKDGYLFSIVVKSSTTLKGVPVCFCILGKEVTEVLVKWLNWSKNTFTLNVKRIMIDCSSTEIAAIKEVLPSVSILLCHWHVKRTWETNIKKEVSQETVYST